MAEISAALVMELRAKTGAKMMDAKRALVDTDGDLEQAINILREKGLADAAKRTHRTTAEGLIVKANSIDGKSGALAELNCETDFVAKNETFINLASSIVENILNGDKNDVCADCLDAALAEEIKATVSKTGENIQFKGGVKYSTEDGAVATYLHLGGKIGVMVQIDGKTDDKVSELAYNIAMQVAAANPTYLHRDDVPAEVLENEKKIYKELAKNEGKPENMLDRIAEGRVEKFYKENCLLDQEYIKDSSLGVKTLVEQVSGEVGAKLTLVKFTRCQLGQE